MEILRRPGQYEQPRTIGKTLQQKQSQRLHTAGIAHQIVRDETLFDILFTDQPCSDYRTTKHSQTDCMIFAKTAAHPYGPMKPSWRETSS